MTSCAFWIPERSVFQPRETHGSGRFFSGFPINTNEATMTDLPGGGADIAFNSQSATPQSRAYPFAVVTPAGNSLTGWATVSVNLLNDDCFVSASAVG